MHIKKLLLLTAIILVSVTGCIQHNRNNNSSQIIKAKKQLIIDLDKKLKEKKARGEVRGGSSSILFNEPLYIGDNDEVVIKGNFLIEHAPISIKIGTHNEVRFNSNAYTILNLQLQQGDLIQMRDRNQQLFLELEVIKY